MLLHKLLPYLLYPVTWIVVLAVLAFWYLRSNRLLAARRSLGGLVLLLFVSASPLVANGLWQSLETQYPPRTAAELPAAGAIVLLGGAVALPAPPRVLPELNEAADRLWFAAELYRAGKAPWIVITGGQVFPQPGLLSEADYHVPLLLSLGVPRHAILLETRSSNTAANAAYTAALLRERGIDDMLLVTSAVHMPRAMLLFKQTGLHIEPAVCDVRVAAVHEPMVLGLMPTARAMLTTQDALREWIGIGFYRARAWLR